jgi:arabinose-5-phosphate isomerase
MKQDKVELAKEVLEIEIEALEALKTRLEGDFLKAVDFILKSTGKVVVTGMGKSGIIGKKLSATLSSTGTPSFFLHPAESSHGDLGVVSPGDVVVAISYGGGSSELDEILKYVKRAGLKLIAITGNPKSKLAENADAVIDVSVEREACPLNLAPTASSTATLAMCDALAMVLLSEKGFSKEDFAMRHPGGALGKKLLTKVKDLMPDHLRLPLISTDELAKEIVNVMTTKEVRGICGVLDKDKNLVGSITDGDIRRWLGRAFESGENPLETTAKDLMSSNPKIISENELAQKALYMMDEFSISSLFVVRQNEKGDFSPVGILHIQDLLDARIA